MLDRLLKRGLHGSLSFLLIPVRRLGKRFVRFVLCAHAFLLELFFDFGKSGANRPFELFRDFCGLLASILKMKNAAFKRRFSFRAVKLE